MKRHFKQIGVMRQLYREKVSKLSTANDMLDEKYGKFGTESWAEFEARALAWYYGNLIPDHRRELKIN